jgi:hypothetical protein
MLFGDRSMHRNEPACAAELGTRVVHPDEFEVLGRRDHRPKALSEGA